MIHHEAIEADMIHHADRRLLPAIGQGALPETGLAANSEIDPVTRGAAIRSLIRSGRIRFGGNKVLKIYGTLACSSGRRMKIANSVFFQSEADAIQAGYRPCGHCLPKKYKQWKSCQK